GRHLPPVWRNIESSVSELVRGPGEGPAVVRAESGHLLFKSLPWVEPLKVQRRRPLCPGRRPPPALVVVLAHTTSDDCLAAAVYYTPVEPLCADGRPRHRRVNGGSRPTSLRV